MDGQNSPPAGPAWLAERFGPVSEVRPLAPDASARAFYRLDRTGGGSAVAMIDPAGGSEACRRMLAAGRRLAEIGVRVPRVLDAEEPRGALLFEDLGDRLLADAVPGLDPDPLRKIYEQAGVMAARISAAPPPTGPDDPLASPVLGRERLRRELAFFVVHDVVARRGVTDRGLLRALGEGLDSIAERVLSAGLAFAHRDFHARNLMLLDDGSLAVVDFQDALMAPATYDLASLVFDPYVELPGAASEAAWKAFWRGTEPSDDDARRALFAWVGVQRLLKAIGTYAYQAHRANRRRFEAFIPVAARRVERLLADLPVEEVEDLKAALGSAGVLGA